MNNNKSKKSYVCVCWFIFFFKFKMSFGYKDWLKSTWWMHSLAPVNKARKQNALIKKINGRNKRKKWKKRIKIPLDGHFLLFELIICLNSTLHYYKRQYFWYFFWLHHSATESTRYKRRKQLRKKEGKAKQIQRRSKWVKEWLI